MATPDASPTPGDHSERKVQFENACGCIVDLGELDAAIKWVSPRPTYRKKRIFLFGKYPAVSVCRKKIRVHRLLMSYWMGRTLDRAEHVHHVNENKLDARKSNLQIMAEGEHVSHHNAGVPKTAIHKRRITEGNRRRWGTDQLPRPELVVSDLRKKYSQGWTINRIARHYRIGWHTANRLISEETVYE